MRQRTKRLIIGLVIADFVLVGVLGTLWVAGFGPGHDRSYHGSVPSTELSLPARELARTPELTPRFPARSGPSDRPVAIVVTCLGCRSGDLLGGFLGRLTTAGIDTRIDLRIIAFGGNAREWRRTWHVPTRWQIHHAPEAAGTRLAATVLHTGDSGQLQLYDERGRWKSTWHLGQLNIDGVRHDLDVLARDRT